MSSDPTLERSFRGHRGGITDLSFNPNMKQLASSSHDNTLMIWNFKPQLRAYRFVGHKSTVLSVEYSPSGHLIASGSKDDTVRVWLPTAKGSSTCLRAHSGSVRCVSFTKDGEGLITASDDKTVKMWNLRGLRFVSSLSGHTNWVRSARPWGEGGSCHASIIVSGADDKTVKIWDCRQKMSCIHTFYDHRGSVNDVSFSPRDGNTIASCSSDRTIKLFDLRTRKLFQHYNAHDAPINAISFHPNGEYLISCSNDNTLRVFDLKNGHLFYTLHGHEAHSTAVTFTREGDYFASGSSDKQVLVWKTNFDQVDDDEDGLEVQETNQWQPAEEMTQNQQPNQGYQQPTQGDDPPVPKQSQGNAKIGEDLPEYLTGFMDHVFNRLTLFSDQIDSLTRKMTAMEERLMHIEYHLSEQGKNQNQSQHVKIETGIQNQVEGKNED